MSRVSKIIIIGLFIFFILSSKSTKAFDCIPELNFTQRICPCMYKGTQLNNVFNSYATILSVDIIDSCGYDSLVFDVNYTGSIFLESDTIFPNGSYEVYLTGEGSGSISVIANDTIILGYFEFLSVTDKGIFDFNVSEPNCPLSNGSIITEIDDNTIIDGASLNYLWSNGQTTSSISNLSSGTYTLTITYNDLTPPYSYCDNFFQQTLYRSFCQEFTYTFELTCDDCESCINSFAPYRGRKYVLSAWVSEAMTDPVPNFQGPQIYLYFPNATPDRIGPFKTGEYPIIDDWQLISEVFTVPATANEIEVELENIGNNDVFFDDIRIHPISSNFKSYVYDPVSLKLVAELDDNNFATFYEYDNEGQLRRVKKETFRGIQTIQESHQNTSKLSSNP